MDNEYEKMVRQLNENRDLLVKAICGYLPCGLRLSMNDVDMDCVGYVHGKVIVTRHLMSALTGVEPELVKPYLRKMDSITKEEYDDYDGKIRGGAMEKYEDWLHKHHLDYRRLIDKGLALEAPADMYND